MKMSCNYADGLSNYEDKGVCGVKEIIDNPDILEEKINLLAEMVRQSTHAVVHTGAGISTAAGIPDFRGPKGVWTLEQQGLKPNMSISFNDAVPTKTHMILVSLAQSGHIHFLVSQNVDGLHLRSGFPPEKFSELHGNMFLDKCDKCERLFIRKSATETVGQKFTGKACPIPKKNGRKCRGKIHDTILDWEHELPLRDLNMADLNSRNADLSICLGTTLQIVPSGNLPVLTKKTGGKLVICNLQPTKHDKKADLLIRGYADVVMEKLANLLNVQVAEYKVSNDPTKTICETVQEYVSSIAFKDEIKSEVKDETQNSEIKDEMESK